MQLGVLFGGGLMGSLLPMLGMMGASAAVNYYVTGKQEKKNQTDPNDLKVSSSAYGRGIAETWGTIRVTGNMFWARDIIEEIRYVGAKGKEKSYKKYRKGKAQRVPEYYGDFCMGLCVGEKEEVIRIWADSNLIYDKYNPEEAEKPGFSREEEDSKKGVSGNKKGRNSHGDRWPFRFYGGTEFQMPDPMIVKYHGDLSPAHRGLCYLAFEHFPLLDFGNRIPTITAEVVPRRERVFVHSAFEPDPDATLPTPKADKSFLDYANMRLTHTERRSVNGVFGELGQVFDLNTRKEVHRWFAPGVEVIGLGSNGHLASYISSGWVSRGVTFHDYRTGDLLKSYGGWAWLMQYRWQDFGLVAMPLPTYAFPMYDATADGLVQYSTMFVGMGGDLFQWRHGPVEVEAQYHTDPSVPQADITAWGASNPFFGLFTWNEVRAAGPGYPGSGDIFLRTPGGQIARFKVDQLSPAGSGAGTFPPLPGAGAVFYNPTVNNWLGTTPELPIWSVAAGLYLVIELEGSRWWASGITERGETRWRTYLGTYGTTGLTGGGLGHARHFGQPGITGSRFSCVPADGVWLTIDVSDGSYEVQQLPDGFPRIFAPQFYLDRIGAILAYSTRLSGTGQGEWVVLEAERYTQIKTSLHEIVSDVCTRASIAESQIDLTHLRNEEITGYIVESPSDARSVLETLNQVYMFDVCESDNRLKFVTRGRASAVTVRQRDLGIMSDDEVSRYIQETRVQEVDLPRITTFSFIDPDNDYLTGTAHYQRPRTPYSTMQSNETYDINVPMALTPEEAKQAAERITLSAWRERVSHEFLLSWAFLALDPTDVVDIQFDDGLTLQSRLIQMDLGGNNTLECTGVQQSEPRYTAVTDLPQTVFPVPAHDPATGWVIDPYTGGVWNGGTGALEDPYTGEPMEEYVEPDYPPLTAETLHDTYGGVSTGIRGGGVVRVPRTPFTLAHPRIMDIPYTDDADRFERDNEFPIYWGVTTDRLGAVGVTLQLRIADGEFSGADTTETDLVHGTLAAALGSPPNGVFATDDQNELVFSPAYDFEETGLFEWMSIPDSEWPSYDNMVLVGKEIILFKDVEFDPETGLIRATTLIRGHRGTDVMAGSWPTGTAFTILNSYGHKMTSLPGSALRQRVYAKALGFSPLQSIAQTPSLVYTGAALKPYAPNDIRRADSGSDSTITWQRRTRVNGPLLDGTGTVPLNESYEGYALFLFSADPDMTRFDPYNPSHTTGFLRQVEVSAATYTYTGTEKTADGIATDATFWAVVAQLSADVTYGFPAKARLDNPNPAYVVT